jgi:hypothetical protein
MANQAQDYRVPLGVAEKLEQVRKRAWKVRLATALVGGLVVLLAAMGLSMAIDRWATLYSPMWRSMLTLSALVVTGLTLFVWIIAAWRYVNRTDKVAADVDRNVPELEERWSTLAQLNTPERTRDVHPAMYRQVAAEANNYTAKVDPHAVVRLTGFTRAAWCLTAVGAVLLIAAVMDFHRTGVLFKRFWLPMANISATEINNVSNHTVVARGESLDIAAEIGGTPVTEATLFLNPEGEDEQTITLVPRGDDQNRLAHRLRSVKQPLKYRLRAGDGQTEWQDVAVADRPELASATLKVTPPEYTQHEPQVFDKLPRRISALTGSMLQFAFKPKQAVTDMHLDMGAGKKQPLMMDADGWYRWEIKLTENFSISPILSEEHGLTNRRPPQCTVQARPDKPPVVRIITPNEEMAVRPDDKVPVTFVAKDDVRVGSAELVIYDEGTKTANGPRILDTIQIPLGEQEGAKEVKATVSLDLSRYKVLDGSELSFAVRVREDRSLAPMNQPNGQPMPGGQPMPQGGFKMPEGMAGTISPDGMHGTIDGPIADNKAAVPDGSPQPTTDAMATAPQGSPGAQPSADQQANNNAAAPAGNPAATQNAAANTNANPQQANPWNQTASAAGDSNQADATPPAPSAPAAADSNAVADAGTPNASTDPASPTDPSKPNELSPLTEALANAVPDALKGAGMTAPGSTGGTNEQGATNPSHANATAGQPSPGGQPNADQNAAGQPSPDGQPSPSSQPGENQTAAGQPSPGLPSAGQPSEGQPGANPSNAAPSAEQMANKETTSDRQSLNTGNPAAGQPQPGGMSPEQMANQNPAAQNPNAQNASAQNPGATNQGSPSGQSPAGMPQEGMAQNGSPQGGANQMANNQAGGSPQNGSPQAGSPQSGSRQSGSPQTGSPQQGNSQQTAGSPSGSQNQPSNPQSMPGEPQPQQMASAPDNSNSQNSDPQNMGAQNANQPQPNQPQNNQSQAGQSQQMAGGNNSPQMAAGSTPPPSSGPTNQLDVPQSSQSSTSNRMRLKIDEWAGSFANQERVALEMAIAPDLAELDELLGKAEKLARNVLDFVDAGNEWQAAQGRDIDSAGQQVARCLQIVEDLEVRTHGTPYAFVGLQMVNISKAHIQPARREFWKVQQTDSEARVTAARDGWQHTVRAREMLAELNSKFETTRQELELAESIEKVKKMYQVFVENSMALLNGENEDNGSGGYRRKRVEFDVDEEYLARLKEVLEMRNKMRAELARILADDPRLLRRFIDSQQNRRRVIRHEMEEIVEQQNELNREVEAWTTADADSKPSLQSALLQRHAESASDLAVDAAVLQDKFDTWLPLAQQIDNADVQTAAKLLQDVATATEELSTDAESFIAQNRRPELKEPAEGEAAEGETPAEGETQALPTDVTVDQLATSAQALHNQLTNLEVSLRQLGMQQDQADLSVFAANRLLETRNMITRSAEWIRQLKHHQAGNYPSAAEVEQYRLAMQTDGLAGKLANVEQQMAGLLQRADNKIPEDMANKSRELLAALDEQTSPNQLAAVYSLRRGQLPRAVERQTSALEGIQKAAKNYDELIKLAIEQLDKLPVQDPIASLLEDPTLDELLAGLEQEFPIEELLGIPNRPSNLQIVGDMQQMGGDNALSTGANRRMMMNQIRQQQRMRMRRMDRAVRRAVDRAIQPTPETEPDELQVAQETVDWNVLLSDLGDDLQQGADKAPPERYRRAIEQYFRQISQPEKSGIE